MTYNKVMKLVLINWDEDEFLNENKNELITINLLKLTYMNKCPLLIILFFLCEMSIIAQEELASKSMQIKEFNSTVILPVLDNDKNVHIFSISDNILTDKNIIHIKYNSETKKISQKVYVKPTDISFKESVGLAVDSTNTISIYFHNKGKGEFHRLFIGKNGILEHQKFSLKTKKEKIVQYISENNQFMMLTVTRNQSILNLYEFDRNIHEKKSFDLNNERFYSKDTKIVPLSDILGKGYLSTISNELSNKARDFGNRLKIYPMKNKIIIALNNHNNGTRIIHLDRQNNKAKVDYVPISKLEFADIMGTSIRTNSFIYKDKIFSLIFSTKLLVIDIKNLENKEILKILKFSPDQEIHFKSTKKSTLPIGPLSLKTTKIKHKTKNAKVFFRNLKYASFAGLYVEQHQENILLKIGGYSPPSNSSMGPTLISPGSTSTSADAFRNVSITSSAPIYSSGNGYSGSHGFEKNILLNSENCDFLSEASYEDIYHQIDELKKDEKGIQLETLLKYDDFFIYGYYNKKNDLYKIIKISP